MQKKLILIDGYGFVFRAYHSMPPLTSPDKTPVGAVYGFTNMIFKMLKDHDADYISVIFDAGRKTFRHDIYSEYKANRPPAPEDLIPQFPIVREAAEAMGLAVMETDGYEADDLIATYSQIAKKEGLKVTIVSSDKDLMQLVDDDVSMFDPMKGKIIGCAEVIEKFGVPPEKVLDVLSLMGDSSDNVPGVPGIGPKTAAELIEMFGDLDSILARAGEIKQNKRRETLIENADKARLSRELIKLNFSAPHPFEIKDLIVQEPDQAKLAAFLQKQGFKSLLAKMGKVVAEVAVREDELKHPHNISEEYSLIKDFNQLINWFKNEKEIVRLAISPIIDKKAGEVGVSLALKNGKACFIKFTEETAAQNSLFDEKKPTDGISRSDFAKAIKPLIDDKSIVKVFYDVKSLTSLPEKIYNFDDIMLMSYSIDAGNHNHTLESIFENHLDVHEDEISLKDFAAKEELAQVAISCKIADFCLRAHEKLRQKLFTDNAMTIYEKMEKPLVYVIEKMEKNGIKLNPARLSELSVEFAKWCADLEKQIYELAGKEFNIGSPKQLGEILFVDMGIGAGKKSKKTNAFSTDAKVLEELEADGHAIAGLILKWRHYSKLKSTYTDSLGKEIASDGRVHTTFAMASTTTGRLSSINPNLQNIPIRSEEGNKIREAFVAESGNKLISADYSQIELRLLAEIADIGSLKKAFKEGHDIHAATAADMFGVDINEVSSDLRRKAKTINFGIIYGISAFGLAQRLGIARSEAAEYIKQYFIKYPGIEKYMVETVKSTRERGYTETIFGRKCYVRGINDKNPAIRQFSERAAINAPLQGSAADIIKKAMLHLQKSIEEKNYKTRMLLQVHDELVLEVPENEVEAVSVLTKKIMENVVSLSVPITANIGVGNNWAEIH